MDIKIREYRKNRALTQQQLAEILGVRQNTICQWEKGKREPSIKMCKEVASVLGVSLDELVG